MAAEVQEALRPASCGQTTLIITVGNTLRSDDGVGPYIASQFQTADPSLVLLDAGDRPENILDQAIGLKPAKVIIVDAADFGGRAGEARVIPEELIPQATLSTHTFPLPVISKILARDTGAQVLFLGIQPKNVGLKEGLSEEVRKTAREIILCMRCI